MADAKSYCLVIVAVAIVKQIASIHIEWDKNAETINWNDIDSRIEDIRMPNWFFIYPGTKWCGVGNIASDYDDLGEFKRTDKCCRTHDHCGDVIEGYQSAHNLTNDRFYSKLHCTCDEEFLQCLKSVNAKPSKIIGNIYFNALGTQCFRSDYPIIGCVKYAYVPWKKCVQYGFEASGQQHYQWFDLPVF